MLACFITFVLLLQADWSVPIQLVIGPEVGISYLTEKASSVSIHNILRFKNMLKTQSNCH